MAVPTGVWGRQVNRWPLPAPPGYPAFLSTAEREAAENEWQKLSTIYAPDLMCAEAIREAPLSPNDERVPEALFRCINAVHLAVSSGDRTNDLAKTAYALLHRRYPDSTWARENRFWYKANSAR